MARTISVLRALGRALKRLYAFALVGILLYVFYLAVSYLVTMVFYPAPVPPRLAARPAHLEAAEVGRQNAPGVAEPEAPSPLAHYHQAQPGTQTDRINSCTVRGCHEPLPHSRSIYVRAFANLHSTFLTCEMCHEAVRERPVKAGWVSIQNGLAVDPPALLQLTRLFQVQRQEIEQDPAAANETILGLLTRVVEISQDPLLRYLQLEIATAEPGSPVWRDAVIRLDEQLATHTRGEYGAKVAHLPAPEEYLRQAEQMRQAAQLFLAAVPKSAEQQRIQDEIHKPILPKPDRCTSCHGDSPPLVDFQALGYSPKRAEFLKTNPIAHEVQSVREGRQFYLPSMTEERR